MAREYLLLTWLLVCIVETKCIIPSKTTFKNALTDLFQLIESSRKGNDLPLIAGCVRLAFHDCVGDGGCDGCIDHTNPDNAGLKRYTEPLDSLYDQKYIGKISRADFYALCAVVALNRSTFDTPDKYTGLSIFKVGRKDCSQSPAEDGDENFPKGTDGMAKTFQYFKDFGFNEAEAIILLGAHTLGRCSLSNSGYDGAWVDNRFSKVSKKAINPLAPTSVLDNSYYNMMVKIPPWKQFETSAHKMQWREPNPFSSTILLNCDMAIFYDLNATDEFGNSDCRLSSPLSFKISKTRVCNPSVGRGITQFYANNNAQFIADFAIVFNRMIEKNSATLQTAANLVKDDPLHKINEAFDEVTKLLNEVSGIADDTPDK
ncbi:putative ascorbate peroxidase isoform X1 [Hydra vulgaris]|uniref:putative ascorbate peroxidase isoform X1 n=1 Tax=Hydra vulgaris TaxID=6087 RepID=UPI000640C8D9|nr:putative ascorbate peroxidase [Hydra vulgaris]